MTKRSKTDMWMPIYIGDYLADTMRLTTLQHGAYFLLMLEYWRQGPLPDDADELSAIARTDRKTWDKSVWPGLKRFFHKHDDGCLHQKRADQERAFAAEKSSKRSDAARSRWEQTDSKHDANASANACDLDEQTECKGHPTCASRPQASPSPSPSSLRSEETLASLVAQDADETASGSCSGPNPNVTQHPDILEQAIFPTADTPDASISTHDSGEGPTGHSAAILTPTDILFRDGLSIVCRRATLTPGKARALIGRWRGMIGNDDTALNRILFDAENQSVAHLQSWVPKAIEVRRRGRPPSAQPRPHATDWMVRELQGRGGIPK